MFAEKYINKHIQSTVHVSEEKELWLEVIKIIVSRTVVFTAAVVPATGVTWMIPSENMHNSTNVLYQTISHQIDVLLIMLIGRPELSGRVVRAVG